MANFYKKPFIYLPKGRKSSGNGNNKNEYFLAQGEPHRIQTSLNINNNDTIYLQNSKLCWFYRYYPFSTNVKIHHKDTLPFTYRANESPLDYGHDIFYAMRLKLRKKTDGTTTYPNYDYYSLLCNYYLYITNLNWSIGFGNESNALVYLLAGKPETGSLYWIQIENSAVTPPVLNIRPQLEVFQSSFRHGYDDWAEIDNPRRNVFYGDYETFSYRCAQRFANYIKNVSELSGEPDAEMFMIGYPISAPAVVPDFSEDELFYLVRFMCELNNGTCPYTYITQHIVQ